MGVTIRFDRADDGRACGDETRVETTGAVVKAVCEALVAADFEARGLACLVFVDDEQFGCVAMHVRPEAFAAIVEGLDPSLRGEGLAALAAAAVADNRLVELEDGLDRAWAGAVPTASLGEVLDEPIADWSNAHAIHAMRGLGFHDFSTADPGSYPAERLAKACAGRFDHDSLRIAEIAAYAIAQGGPGAMVMVA